jgi:Ca-activated chloride channel family protein
MKRFVLVLLVLSFMACSQSKVASQFAAPQPPAPPIPAGDASVTGVCQAKDGSVLPGVSVYLSDAQGHANGTVTDSQGRFAFRMVTPGQYTILWNLAGYGHATRVVTIAPGKTLFATGTLNASVSESITVTADAPLMDVRKAGTGMTVSMNEASGGRRSPGSNNAPAVVVPNVSTWNMSGVNITTSMEGATTAFYAPIAENGYNATKDQAVTTFSIDVDKASYSNVRRYLTSNLIPPPDSVRVEEMLNYFTYHYPQPADGRPLAVSSEVTGCPWNPTHRLLRIGLQARKVDTSLAPPNNLVFLLDVSGSMQPHDRLPLIKSALRLLVDQLRGQDSVAIVVYAGSAGLVLPPTAGSDKAAILAALDRLQSGGSTNGADGIRLAYKVAKEKFFTKGNNRVILATDGDFNVGVSSFEDLTKLIEEQRTAGIYLTCLGVGVGDLQDGKIEMLADKGNGAYFYLDGMHEAKKVFQNELAGTLMTVADDVKVQLAFDPSAVASYRQIGYENRALANKDFMDDKKDAGELGSGHSVTALYEIEPLRHSGTIATLKIRYKDPGAASSQEMAAAIVDEGKSMYDASSDTQFAAAVAEFGMLLRDSKYKGTATWADVTALARAMRGEDIEGYREELIRMLDSGRSLLGDRKVATK